MVKLIIDSGTDENQWFKEKYDYNFLPLTIIFEDETFLDQEEMKQDELISLLRKGHFLRTSQPSPGEVKEMLEESRKKDEEVIIVSIWKKISGTYQVIKSIVDQYKEEDPDFKISLIDCRSGSVAGTIISIQIMEMINAGYSYKEIVKQARWNAENISIYLTVADVKWLVKSGRLSGMAGAVGSALKVKPLLTVDEEKIYSDGMARGEKRIYKKMVRRLKEDTKKFSEQLYCISHVGEEKNAKKVEKLIQEEIPGARTMIFEFGAVLGAHIGIGGVAIAGLTVKPKNYILPEI